MIVEDRLGEVLIDLYESSEIVRTEREAKEESERRRKEEELRRERHREQHNAEIRRTVHLVNMAKDYDIACKIRAYITALKSGNSIKDEEMEAQLDWARKKADWYDPTVARNDELLGKRQHRKNEDEKALKEQCNYSYWSSR